MSLLTIDTAQLLDSSTAGSAAAKVLTDRWEAAASKSAAEKQALLAELQVLRDSLRRQLLERAQPVIAEIAKKKKATAVLDKAAVVFGTLEDITDAVMARVDAQGPLK